MKNKGKTSNLEISHFNRLKEIMLNEENEFQHWFTVWKMLMTFKKMFGASELYTELLKIEAIFFKVVLKKSRLELKELTK